MTGNENKNADDAGQGRRHDKSPALAEPNAGHRQRMRNRFLRDAAALDDYEILELLLGYAQPRKDTRGLAKELLHRFETLEGVFGAKPEELMYAPGMGQGLSLFCRLVRECHARCAESPTRQRMKLDNPGDLMHFARLRLGSYPHEEVWIGTVDNGNRLIGWERLHKGTVNAAPIYPREILKKALQDNAGGFFLAHNHPGGRSEPSKMDLSITYKIATIARELEINFMDHIIVTADACFSMRLEGRLG